MDAPAPPPVPKISPRPWAVDPDDRESMEWNVHIVEQARPYMRVCFMSNCSQAEANADLIMKAVNNHDALVKALKAAIGHIEHMAPWITKQNLGYSFEGLGEDMPGIRAALRAASSAGDHQSDSSSAEEAVVQS